MTEPRIPSTKAARQQLIADLLGKEAVRSQGDLVDLLTANGVHSTASTVSRDLVAQRERLACNDVPVERRFCKGAGTPPHVPAARFILEQCGQG